MESLWLAQRWLRKLPSWREDCLAAGATLAASRPGVSEVVRELERAAYCDKMRLLGEFRSARGTQVVPETSPDDPTRDIQTPENKASSEQMLDWQNAEHWAAFVV